MRIRDTIGIALSAAVVTLGAGAVIAAAHPASVTPAQSPPAPAVDLPEPGDTPDVPGAVDAPEPEDVPDLPGQ
jgi:hypothetical protein